MISRFFQYLFLFHDYNCRMLTMTGCLRFTIHAKALTWIALIIMIEKWRKSPLHVLKLIHLKNIYFRKCFTAKRIQDRSKVSSIKPKFDDQFFVDFSVLYKLRPRNYFCFDLKNWQNNFRFTKLVQNM